MPKPPVSHAAWLKSKKSTLKSTSNSMESISSELLQKISDLEKTMNTETEKIMKYLRKVEDQSKKRDHEAFRRINDLENGGLSRRGKGSDGVSYAIMADALAKEAENAYEGKIDFQGDQLDSIFEKETAQAKAKKSKRKKKKSKKHKKSRIRKKNKKKTKRKGGHYLVGGTKRDREDDRYGGNQCTKHRWVLCPWPTRLCSEPDYMREECGEF